MTTYRRYPLGYYVYAYIRNKDSITATKGTPYYIGKGKGDRAWESHKRNNNTDLRPKELHLIVILEQNLTDIGALALERRLIKWYGRIDNGTGILRNLTDGGDGTAGAKPSPEIVKIRAEKNKGKIRTPEMKRKISLSKIGIRHSVTESTKLKISKAMKGGNNPYYGKKHTAEIREKIREGRRRNPPNQDSRLEKLTKVYEITWPDNTITIIKGLNPFCRHIGLSAGTMSNICNSEKTYKGFKCKKLDSYNGELYNYLTLEPNLIKFGSVRPE